MKNWELTRSNILAAQVPANTDTYTAIPHRVFLEELQEQVQLKGYNVHSERFLATKEYQVLTGSFSLNKMGSDYPMGDVMKPTIYFVNSYNKTRKANVHGGAMVLVCKNGMMRPSSTAAYTRKHTGTALQDFREHMNLVIDQLEEEYDKLERNAKQMQAIGLDKKVIAQLVGDMIINEELITATQLSILTREIKMSVNFKDDTLWSFYNHCTEAFKDTHPLFYDKQHIKFHSYILDKFSLEGASGLYGGQLEVDTSLAESIQQSISVTESTTMASLDVISDLSFEDL